MIWLDPSANVPRLLEEQLPNRGSHVVANSVELLPFHHK
eukprot:SAG11_NODE_1916_length_4071_cov_3.418429_9_plen_39_part_00